MAPTSRQQLGETGEKLVTSRCPCPRCKRTKTLRRLPNNFKCADVICDFCGFLAQVKASRVNDVYTIPNRVLGGAWRPTKERIDAGIYFPLYLVLVDKADSKTSSIWYLSPDLQPTEMYLERKPLSATAKRAGWQGFLYDLSQVKSHFVKLFPDTSP